MEAIVCEKAPPAIGPYCAGIRVGNQIWCSGQTAYDPVAGKLVSEDIGEQTKKTLENLKSLLEATGSSLAKVFKCTVYMTDLDEFAAMNKAYAEMFGDNKPARACVGVATLLKGARVEIDCVAEV
ncbi:MAG TPA: Rid family detoxifying hydrolase [Opitutales bacterium]|mgnify:CR=1 FL=1|nr:Rid family detoxifying hydrolase [Opitutales bacterium]